MTITSRQSLALAAIALLIGIFAVAQTVRANAENVEILDPTTPTVYGAAPVDVDVTFRFDATHCIPGWDYIARIRVISEDNDIVAEEVFTYDWSTDLDSCPVIGQVKTETITIPAGTAPGSYDLNVRVDEFQLDGVFGDEDTVEGAIIIAAGACPPGWDLVPAGEDNPRDRNGDGAVCEKDIPGQGQGNQADGTNQKDNNQPFD